MPGSPTLTDTTRTVDTNAAPGGIVTFDLPPTRLVGHKLLLMLSNDSAGFLSTAPDSGTGAWTTHWNTSEEFGHVMGFSHVLEAGDGATVDVGISTMATVVGWTFIVTDVDLSSWTNSIQSNGNVFNQSMVDHNSGNTNQKLWICHSLKDLTGHVLLLNADKYFPLAQQIHDETVGGFSTVIGWRDSDGPTEPLDAQTMFRIEPAGPPWWPHYIFAVSGDLISVGGAFVAQADAPVVAVNLPGNARHRRPMSAR